MKSGSVGVIWWEFRARPRLWYQTAATLRAQVPPLERKTLGFITSKIIELISLRFIIIASKKLIWSLLCDLIINYLSNIFSKYKLKVLVRFFHSPSHFFNIFLTYWYFFSIELYLESDFLLDRKIWDATLNPIWWIHCKNWKSSILHATQIQIKII